MRHAFKKPRATLLGLHWCGGRGCWANPNEYGNSWETPTRSLLLVQHAILVGIILGEQSLSNGTPRRSWAKVICLNGSLFVWLPGPSNYPSRLKSLHKLGATLQCTGSLRVEVDVWLGQ